MQYCVSSTVTETDTCMYVAPAIAAKQTVSAHGQQRIETRFAQAEMRSADNRYG